MRAFRILVADDHELVRRGLRALIRPQRGWRICGEATNGREAVAKAKQLKPDVVVLDISMPQLDGLEATRQIRAALPETEVLVLTMHESEQMVRRVMEAGARSYVSKSDVARDLIRALRALRQAKFLFSAKISSVLSKGRFREGTLTPDLAASDSQLTRREREITRLLTEGRSNKQVADALGITVKTVESHRANIMRKLGFHSVIELVHYAIRNNMVQPPGTH